MNKKQLLNPKHTYAVGIDLHGTLLNEDWKIDDESLLLSSLNSLTDKCNLYICTGNDLHFIEEYIPLQVRSVFDGFILESGAVISDGIKEQVLISDELKAIIKKTEEDLKELKIPEILFFARRLASISMFTKNKTSGTHPYKLWEYISAFIAQKTYAKYLSVTHSDVAVDIFPAAVSKFTAFDMISSNQHKIAIADSFNDWDFLAFSDLSCLPANACSHLEQKAADSGYTIHSLSQLSFSATNNWYKSENSYTAGVVDILRKILATHKLLQ